VASTSLKHRYFLNRSTLKSLGFLKWHTVSTVIYQGLEGSNFLNLMVKHSETSVTLYQLAVRNVSGELNLQQHHFKNFESQSLPPSLPHSETYESLSLLQIHRSLDVSTMPTYQQQTFSLLETRSSTDLLQTGYSVL